ncbi:hypothetical protein Avbf_09200, partial [Armadillidium vulgare]
IEEDSIVLNCCNGSLITIRHFDYQHEVKKNYSMCFSLDLVNDSNGSLYIGQDQDLKDGGFNRLQSFRGYMSEFFMYDRLMTEEELSSFVNCSSNFKIDKRHSVCDFSDLENDFLINNVVVLENESSRKRTFINVNSEYKGFNWVGAKVLITNETEISFQHYLTSQILRYHNFIDALPSEEWTVLCAIMFGDKAQTPYWQGDCSDNSDEIDCQSLIKPPEYSNIVPPPRLNKKNKTSIKFYFDIFAVKKIDIKEFTFAIEMSLTMIWRDSRLTFRNLREQEHLNITEDRDLPWTPQYFFLGDEEISSDIQFLSRSVFVRKNSPSIEDNDENILREEIFLGKKMILHCNTIYTNNLLSFRPLFVPFNTQEINFILMLQKGQENFVILSPIEDGAKFHGVRRQLQFYVRGPKLMTIINSVFQSDKS